MYLPLQASRGWNYQRASSATDNMRFFSLFWLPKSLVLSSLSVVLAEWSIWKPDVYSSLPCYLVQVLLDSPDGDGTDSSQMGDQSMNEGFGTGAEWLKWTELDPEEETIANCWTELIDVESGEEQVSIVE
jgi:hypothetical protein